jgi:hypothetical protein
MANDAEVSQYVNERNANRRYEDWEPVAEWAQDQDRPTYAWTIEGEVYAGTLQQYATDHQQAHYNGSAVGDLLWTGEELIRPHIVQTAWDEDDYATVHFTLHRDEASYRLDGRA